MYETVENSIAESYGLLAGTQNEDSESDSIMHNKIYIFFLIFIVCGYVVCTLG